MTLSNLLSTFRRFTIEPFDSEGAQFDPNLHQAMFQAPVPDKEPGTVFTVQKQGYMIGNRCLRPAQVGVVQEK
jgi:molecular chaperone GrpE